MFKQMMPIFSRLDCEEVEILLHMLRNKNRSMIQSEQRSNDLIDQACDNSQNIKLAKLSEEANFAMKNRYKFDKDVMKFADKKKMPIDSRKVKDILRNQHVVRQRINDDIGTYRAFEENTAFDNGVLTYVNEAAWGDLRDLLKDIGINDKTIQYANVADLLKLKDECRLHESDANYKNLRDARLTVIDMTDYEHNFGAPNEVGDIPFMNATELNAYKEEQHPMSHSVFEVVELEKPFKNATTMTMRAAQEARDAEAEEEEEEEEDDDDDDEDDEYGDEEEGEGEGEEEEEEEDGEEEEEAEEEFAPKLDVQRRTEDSYFMHNEKLRERFNEVELDGFMKMLNIKPFTQWQDDTVHHYKLGNHNYEDEAQMTDPYFHLLAEVERKHLEKQMAVDFRRGTEVKLIPDPRKAPHLSRQ